MLESFSLQLCYTELDVKFRHSGTEGASGTLHFNLVSLVLDHFKACYPISESS